MKMNEERGIFDFHGFMEICLCFCNALTAQPVSILLVSVTGKRKQFAVNAELRIKLIQVPTATLQLKSLQTSHPTMSEIIVFFDLETTGLDTSMCHLIQLAAISGDRLYNVYTLPRQPIPRKVKQLTGFDVLDGSLYLNRRCVGTKLLQEALQTFIAFLRNFKRPVILAAHSAKKFDAPVLHRLLLKCGLLEEFQEVVSGFLDTLLLSRRLFTDLPSYNQEFLVQYFLRKTYNAHNAVGDARTLQELYSYWNPGPQDVILSRF
ncbi:DNA polymerase III subunit epsilon-like [Aulostomus maculatus]